MLFPASLKVYALGCVLCFALAQASYLQIDTCSNYALAASKEANRAILDTCINLQVILTRWSRSHLVVPYPQRLMQSALSLVPLSIDSGTKLALARVSFESLNAEPFVAQIQLYTGTDVYAGASATNSAQLFKEAFLFSGSDMQIKLDHTSNQLMNLFISATADPDRRATIEVCTRCKHVSARGVY
jgi:hypothetical protein